MPQCVADYKTFIFTTQVQSFFILKTCPNSHLYDIIQNNKEKKMNPIIGEILGYACGACTTIAFLPQAIKSIISKDVSGLSLSMYVIYCIGLIFWVLYGVYLDSFQIILFNSITLIFNSIILYMIIKNQKHKK